MTGLFSKILSFLVSITLAFSTASINHNGKNEDKNKDLNQQSNIVTEIIEDIPKPQYVAKSNKTNSPISTSGWWTYPNVIKLTSRNGNDLLVLVNKEFRLSENYTPNDLISAANSGIRRGSGHLIRNIIVNDLRELVNAAKNDGIDLSIRSGYRSYPQQATTYNYWLKVNGNNPDEADKVSARAGHSQHQLGTVVDFSSAEIQDGIGGQFANTKAARWLAENAWKYGFVISFPKGYESTTGYIYESWHYRYIGKSNAQEMINRGEVLEIYLRSKN